MTEPRRLLLVSATIGEGHNATARAVEEAARRSWPGCEVSWLDALRAMGPWVPRTFGRIYVTNVQSTPWLYDFFYAALWRQRWFANGCRRFVGAWAGRRLRPLLADERPDLIVSTYPMGTAGLAWLRARGELRTPVAAVISDFAPHPFWVYSAIDRHYAMSEVSAGAADLAEPAAVNTVSAPPVVAAFHPRDKAEARRACGLPQAGFVVLISCGSLGFGSVDRAVEAALRAGTDQVVVVCGRNDTLRERLLRRAERDSRIDPLGWVDDMATRTAAADVVVTNAGGATALEALACARPVLMFEPIAGHGRANAELMERAGLAELCDDEPALAQALHRLATEPGELHNAEQRMLRHLRDTGEFADQVADMANLDPAVPERMRAQDTFFVHVTTPQVAQQTGAVLSLRGPAAGAEWGAELAARVSERIAARAPELPMVSKRLVTRRHREPHWVPVRRLAPEQHLRRITLGEHDDQESAEREFFSTPLPTDRPPWEMAVLHRPGSGDSALLVKMHHSLGDGLVMTSTLLRLLCDEVPDLPEQPRPAIPRLRYVTAVLRGMLSLVTAGPAPRGGLGGRSTGARRFAWKELDAAEVEAEARANGVSRSALLLGMVAEALHRLDENNTHQRNFRTMVPRKARAGTEDFGNHAVAVTVDLPIGPMSPRRRLAEVAARLDRAQHRGQPQASEAVLRGLRLLPAPLHRWVCRRIYGRNFFQAIVSIMPGHRTPVHIAGALLRTVYPVLPLADGMALAIGTIGWGRTVGVALTTDAALLPDVDKLADQLPSAFAALRLGAQEGA